MEEAEEEARRRARKSSLACNGVAMFIYYHIGCAARQAANTSPSRSTERQKGRKVSFLIWNARASARTTVTALPIILFCSDTEPISS